MPYYRVTCLETHKRGKCLVAETAEEAMESTRTILAAGGAVRIEDLAAEAMPDEAFEEFDGYHTEETLQVIRDWDRRDAEGLLAYLRERWQYDAWDRDGNDLQISTMGWSGNEDLIRALQDSGFWTVAWAATERGGHYTFDLSTYERWAKEKEEK